MLIRIPSFIVTALAGALLTTASTPTAAGLIASLQPENSITDAFDQQSIGAVPTRVLSGDPQTLAAVGGTLSIMGGQEVGTGGGTVYPGFDLRSFAQNTLIADLNRFGSPTQGGLVVWDYDLSGYLAGVSVGSGAGQSSFTLDLDYSDRRSEAVAAEWYISYNGGGLALDTTDITAFAVSGSASGASNAALVTDAAKFNPLVSLSGSTAGTESIDITADLATIAAGDGLVRIAYLEGGFLGDIRLRNASGIVETVNPVPEPSGLIVLACMAGIVGVRSHRSTRTAC